MLQRLTTIVLFVSCCIQPGLVFSFAPGRISAVGRINSVKGNACKYRTSVLGLRCSIAEPPTTTEQKTGLELSKTFPRLPCVISTPKAKRIRLAELIEQSQSSLDVCTSKFLDTKRDIELHLTRFADETVSDFASTAEVDTSLAENGEFNELRLKRLIKMWELKQDSSIQAKTIPPMFSQPNVARPRVVVLGSGWGAHAVAKVSLSIQFETPLC